jgi:hypothetical protein
MQIGQTDADVNFKAQDSLVVINSLMKVPVKMP